MIYLQKNSRNWWIKFRLGEKIIRVSSGTRDKKKAKAIEKTLLLARQGEMPGKALHNLIDSILGTTQDPMTTGTPLDTAYILYEKFLKAKNKTISPKEMILRERRLIRLSNWIEKNRPDIKTIEQVDRLCALAFAESLAKENLTSKARANIISSLSTVWNALARLQDNIKHNPWYAVSPEVTDTRRGQPFTREQSDAIIRAADEIDAHGWGLACRIALYTGLRLGDITRLKWHSFDLTTGTLTITPNKTARHDVTLIIPIATPLLEALKNTKQKETLIFPEFKPHPAPLPIPFRNILTAAGLDPAHYTFHSWRHTFRTRLAEAGVSDDIAKRLGGWKNDKMAMHYAHGGREQEMQEAVNRI